MTPRRPIRNQAHPISDRDERAESIGPALLVMLMWWVALVAWLYVAWAAR